MDERAAKKAIIARNRNLKDAEEAKNRERKSQAASTRADIEYRRVKLAVAIEADIASNLHQLGNERLDDAQEWNIIVRNGIIMRLLSGRYSQETSIYGWSIGSWLESYLLPYAESSRDIREVRYFVVLCTNGNFYICTYLGEPRKRVSVRGGMHADELPMKCLKIIAEDWGISVD